ncbi:MAG: 3-hydroxyacyl-CoA dehydrogenase NAD-binding domain-containing protein [Terracidiphilus sp.]
MPLSVAIIGAGPLGRRLAWRAARAGFRVSLEDVLPSNLEHAREAIRRDFTAVPQLPNLGASEAEWLFHQEKATSNFAGNRSRELWNRSRAESLAEIAGGGIRFVSSIEDAAREADLAIDCVPDELESKLEILWLLYRMAPPRTVFATPTTNLSIADLGACTYRADKCIAIAASPAELADLAANPTAEIRLRAASVTAAETIAVVEQFWRSLGCSVRIERAIE